MTAPPRRRDLGTALGRVGRSVVAGTGAGGSHDDHLRRLITDDGEEWSSGERGPIERAWRFSEAPTGNRVTWVRRLVPKVWNQKGPSTGTVTVRLARTYQGIEGQEFRCTVVVQVLPWDPTEGAAPAYLGFDSLKSHVCGGEFHGRLGASAPWTAPFDMRQGEPHALVVVTWNAAYPNPDVIVTSSARPV